MEDIIRAIESEINRKETELAALRQSLESLRGLGSRSSASSAVGIGRVSSDKFHGGFFHSRSAVGSAVRQFMQLKRSASLEEIREGLDRGGIKWGKYPKRQVALAVANSPTVYALKDGTVTLL